MDDLLESDQADKPSPPRSGGRNIFQVFWQRRGLIFFGGVLGVTLAVLTYSQRPSLYRATAQVLVVKKQEGNALSVTGMVVMDDYVATHLIVIRSQTVVKMAVNKKDLGSLKSLQGRDPVGTIQAGLVAAREASKEGTSGGNNILNLSYSGSDPSDVEVILRSVIESYKDFLDKTFENTSETTVALIRTAIDTLNTNLKTKNEEYRKFRNSSDLLIRGENGVPDYESKILEYRKKETESHEQVELIEKRIKAIQKAVDEKKPREFILALAERRYEKGVSNQNRDQKANATALETALLPLFAQELDLKLFYGDDHPELIRVRNRIKLTRETYEHLDQIAREGEMAPVSNDPVRNMIQAMLVEQQLARTNYEFNKGLLDDELKTARRLEDQYQTDRDFLDHISRIKKVLDSTLRKLEEINLVRGVGGFEAKALAEPSPGAKTSPVLWQFLFMGAALGFGLAAVSAYLLDLADKSFRNPEEIRRRLGLPIVGHVPFVQTSAEPVMTVDGAGNPLELDPGLIALHQPTSPVSEGFRGIRTALYFKTHGQRHNVIQVTSPNMGDGKTTLITNLAVSIAQSGRKVLIIDADLRRPRVHRSFGLAGKIGLAEVIAGTAELDEAIQITVVPNLSVLPCGRRPQNPAELLTLPQFEDVIDDLRSAFDFVLIDTPPLLAVSDPCIIAPRVDGLLLTIRLSKNGRPSAERARDLLVGLRANCIGVVVNGVGKHGSMSGYGYEHYKYADEYTAAYSTMDESSVEQVRVVPKVVEKIDLSAGTDAKPAENPVSTLAGSVEPSTNGHPTHPPKGE